MTIKFLDLYNEVAGQAWSMFDPDAESEEDFESGLKTSINKALYDIWVSYPHKFRIKTKTVRTAANQEKYTLPDGNIMSKTVGGETVYGIKIDKEYLDYTEDYELLEEKTGKPELFYIDENNYYLYPTPDAYYNVTLKYLTLAVGYSRNGDAVYSLEKDDDYIDIPAKYEELFKNAVITKSMLYAIAAPTDENYMGYKEQYDKAYKDLIAQQRGIDLMNKRISW